MKQESSLLRARTYVDALAARGRHSFTSAEAGLALGVTANAATKALARLMKQGYLASPERGFYVIVSPEYRSLGCLPPEQFVPGLMALRGLSYYVGLLSAAQFHGAARQRPQRFQVMLAKNRRPIVCGKVHVGFIARKRLDEVPIRHFNTPRGEIRVSTPEATAIDLIGYPDHAGGLEHVATVLAELAERIDPEKLPAAAATAPLPWAQRLGFLLEQLGAVDRAAPLKRYVHERVRDHVPLVSGGVRDGDRDAGWKVVLNATIEADA